MVRGRKRHLVTDAVGLVRVVRVTAANGDDGATAPRVPAARPAAEFPRRSVAWAGRTYRNDARDAWLAGPDRLRVEVTAEPDGATGFVPPPKGRVVEQTFGCRIESRRLVRDDERVSETSAALVTLSCTHRMARRARPPRGQRTFRYRRKTVA